MLLLQERQRLQMLQRLQKVKRRPMLLPLVVLMVKKDQPKLKRSSQLQEDLIIQNKTSNLNQQSLIKSVELFNQNQDRVFQLTTQIHQELQEIMQPDQLSAPHPQLKKSKPIMKQRLKRRAKRKQRNQRRLLKNPPRKMLLHQRRKRRKKPRPKLQLQKMLLLQLKLMPLQQRRVPLLQLKHQRLLLLFNLSTTEISRETKTEIPETVIHLLKFLKNKWISNLIISQELSMKKDIETQRSSIMLSSIREITQEWVFTLGNFMIMPSLSQELEDTISSNTTWTWSNTWKTTLTKTSPTHSMLPTSSKSAKPPKLNSMLNITTENSLTQLSSIQKLITQSHGLTSNSEKPNWV